MLVFGERGKPENPGKAGEPGESRRTRGKPFGTEHRTNKLNPHCFVCYFSLISLQLINHSKLLTQPLNYEKKLVAIKSQRRDH